MLNRQEGFTLVELIMVLGMISILILTFAGVLIIVKGNIWYDSDSVVRELKADHPGVTEILKTERNIFNDSVITVRENGINRDYCLDSSILWNYEFTECSK